MKIFSFDGLDEGTFPYPSLTSFPFPFTIERSLIIRYDSRRRSRQSRSSLSRLKRRCSCRY